MGKMGTVICLGFGLFVCFFHWKMRFGSFRLGITNSETMKSGNRIGIWAKCRLKRWDLAKIWDWEMRFVPLPLPSSLPKFMTPSKESSKNFVTRRAGIMPDMWFMHQDTIYPQITLPP